MPAVYTRTGDRGDTGLFGGSRVPKQSLRVEAYGTVDEGNAALGQAKAGLERGEWRDRVHHIQQRLFVLAAELASDEAGAAQLADRVEAGDVNDLERLIDDCLAITGPQRAFVVPGRDERSAAFHTARTVLRRAERRVLTLGEHEVVRAEIVRYLNRCSDAVYALARLTETWADAVLIEQIVRAQVGRQFGLEEPDTAPGRWSAMPGVATTTVGLELAKSLARAVESRAARVGVPVVVSVCDEAGNPVLLHRMTDSLLASVDIATNKAWSAVAFKQPTSALADLASQGGPLPGLGDGNHGRVVLFGGGVPIRVGDRIVGGLGVSGGTVDEDCDIVTYAMTTVMGEHS